MKMKNITGFDWDDGNKTKCQKHGVTNEGRHIFVAFTSRKIGEKTYIRPISSRYMHQKEVDYYEEITRIKNG